MPDLKHREPEKSPTGGDDIRGIELKSSYEDPSVEEEKVGLKRQVGLLSGIALIVGSMIGSGVFVSPKGVLVNTESVGMSLVIWTLCGVIATLGALCYAELGTMIPKSGGEHAYLNHVYGPPIAFLFAWTAIIVLKPSALAIISLSFGEYAVQPFYEGSECGPPTSATKLMAVLCVILIVVINCGSVKAATAVQNFFTAAKLLACAIIVVVGFVEMGKGNTEHINPANSFKGSTSNVFAYGLAFYQGLWAYEGWNQLNYITEELINPYRNLPLAIVIGIPLVTTVYVLVNMAYFTVLSPEELLQSGAVAVTFANRTLGPMAWIMPVAVVFSTFGAANGMCFASSRLTFVAAREGHMVKILSMVHAHRITPFAAVIFQAIIAVLMMIPSDFDTLVNYFSFAAWMFYGATALAVLILRYKEPDTHRPVKIPIVIPAIVMLISLYLVIAPIIDEPTLEFLYAALFILAGFILYFPFVHFGYHPKFMNSITTFFQLLCEVVPGAETAETSDVNTDVKQVAMS